MINTLKVQALLNWLACGAPRYFAATSPLEYIRLSGSVQIRPECPKDETQAARLPLLS